MMANRWFAGALLMALALGGSACTMRMTLPPVTPLDPRAPPPTDEQLTAAVQARIDQIWILYPRDIRIRTQDRVVYLVGWVQTDSERDLVAQIARTTPGVLAINNDVRRTYPW